MSTRRLPICDPTPAEPSPHVRVTVRQSWISPSECPEAVAADENFPAEARGDRASPPNASAAAAIAARKGHG